MSWSISASGPADEVLEKLEKDEYVPKTVKEYIGDGIEALKVHYGGDVAVTLSANGHLHDGKEGNWDNTTATITVAKQA